MRIHLSKYQWHNNENIWVIGFVRHDNRFLVKDELINYFSGADSFKEFETLLKSANGQFSIVIKWFDVIWAASDRLKNYPLFYTRVDEHCIISDDCYSLAEIQPELGFNTDAISSFLAAGYVINNLTLINNVFQIEAGGYAILGNSLKTGYYHNISNEIITQKNFDTLAGELQYLIPEVFGSYLKSLKNRFIAVPLSGGYDSRLIAVMCAEFHPENVICYTYGIRNNPEVANARETSKRLGLKWINIVYDEEIIRDFLTDNVFKEYYPYASELSGMFFLQDYFAVKYLMEERLVPDDCVFIPGFSGDMLAGSHLAPGMNIGMDSDQITQLIFKEYFRLIKLDGNSKSSITDLIEDKIGPGEFPAWKVIESFDMKERQAKFVINSAKVFKYFGYDYILPFWDNQLADFFSSVPFHLKLNKKLYDYVLTEKIFKNKGLNFRREINPSPFRRRLQRIKEKIKPMLPFKIKNMFIKAGSPILYDEITKLMLNDFGVNPVIVPQQPNYYNSYIAQWYLLRTREYFKIKD